LRINYFRGRKKEVKAYVCNKYKTSERKDLIVILRFIRIVSSSTLRLL